MRRTAAHRRRAEFSSRREPLPARQRLDYRSGDGVLQSSDDLPSFDHRRPIVNRQYETRGGDNLLDRRLFLPFRRAMISGDPRLRIVNLVERLNRLIGVAQEAASAATFGQSPQIHLQRAALALASSRL
jgi:hypothetical protein